MILQHLAILLLVGAAHGATWLKTLCPASGSTFKSCTQPTSFATDVAVTLFFQIETRTVGTTSFSCVDGADADVTFCARSWTDAESGAAGSCFFLVPAGRSLACSASGGAINVIDAAYIPLAVNALGAPQALACPSGALAPGKPCKQLGLPQDQWVVATYAGGGAPAASAFACSVGGVEVCSFATALSGPSDVSSCSFLLPANNSLLCAATQGSISFPAPAVGFPLAMAYAGNLSSDIAPCPPAGPKPNDCDCDIDTAGNKTDTFVSITLVASILPPLPLTPPPLPPLLPPHAHSMHHKPHPHFTQLHHPGWLL